MKCDQSFSSLSFHVHDELPIKSQVNDTSTNAPTYASLDIGGNLERVNIRLVVWDRDTLRRLADAAARAYHEWTKAEHEAATALNDLAEAPADPTGVDCAERYDGIDA